VADDAYPAVGTQEREEIEEIRAWLSERGWKLGTGTKHGHEWTAPLMRTNEVQGSGPYGRGPTPVDAARHAKQMYLDTPEMQYVDRAGQ
jgi:hypothetical protein